MASELKFDMLRWQREVFADKHRFKVVVAGRRCGKTFMSAIDLIAKTLACPDRLARVMYVAPTQSMAHDLMWDLLHELARPVIAKSHINDGNITMVNGVTLQIRGADKPDRLRGKKLFHATLDEMKDMKDEVWEMNVAPSLSDMEGSALFIGTPEPGDSVFRDLYNQGLDGGDPEFKSWHFTTADNETMNPKEIESAKRRMSTMAFKQEYLASFDSMGADVFKEEWFQYGDEPKEGDWYIAVDLAGFEEVSDPNKKRHLDDTAIAVVKITPEGKWFVKKVEMFRKDVKETALRILMNIRTYRPRMIGIEKGALMRAVMPYLSDLMGKHALYCHIEPISTSGSSKKGSDAIANRVIFALQGLFEHGRITFSKTESHDKLKDQILMFPSSKCHDDGVDALSLVAHLQSTVYVDPNDVEEEWTPVDIVAGL